MCKDLRIWLPRLEEEEHPTANTLLQGLAFVSLRHYSRRGDFCTGLGRTQALCTKCSDTHLNPFAMVHETWVCFSTPSCINVMSLEVLYLNCEIPLFWVPTVLSCSAKTGTKPSPGLLSDFIYGWSSWLCRQTFAHLYACDILLMCGMTTVPLERAQH